MPLNSDLMQKKKISLFHVFENGKPRSINVGGDYFGINLQSAGQIYMNSLQPEQLEAQKGQKVSVLKIDVSREIFAHPSQQENFEQDGAKVYAKLSRFRYTMQLFHALIGDYDFMVMPDDGRIHVTKVEITKIKE